MSRDDSFARDETFSRLLFGTLTMGPLQRNLPPERGAELLCYAAARGVRFVDTAEYYRTYPHIREALRAGAKLSVCTKSYAYDRDGAKRSVELAQEGIGRERIDVFLMHEQESAHTLRGHADAFSYYLSLKEEGVIGRVGISTHHVAAVNAAAMHPEVDVIFAIINEKGLGIADGARADMERALSGAHGRGILTLGMKVLGGGHMIGERERALSYALGLPYLDAIAVGMQSEAEIDYNIAVFAGEKPGTCAAEASRAAQRRLLVEAYCEGCGRCEARCGQGAISIREGRAEVDHARCVRCGYCAGVCPVFCLKVI